MTMFMRTRHYGKQPEKGHAVSPGGPVWDPVTQAVRAEGLAADGLLALPQDCRRVNVHWTHVRTKNRKEVQPHKLISRSFDNNIPVKNKLP